MYFNYHAKLKRLIREGHLVEYKIVERHNAVSPALVLYFDNNKPCPVRKEHFTEYIDLIEHIKGSKDENKT